MRRERDEIEHHMRYMKPGTFLSVPAREFCLAYPCGWPSIYETHEQAFLSSAIGSASGVWRVVFQMGPNPAYVISRHEEDVTGRRHYVDPDRAYLFDQQPDGTFVRNGTPYVRR